jgi:hypothetical protein
VKKAKRGPTRLFTERTERGWYIIIGKMAVCSYHGSPHIHRHASRTHPAHRPRIPVDPKLTFAEALDRIGKLCEALDREPGLDELLEALA